MSDRPLVDVPLEDFLDLADRALLALDWIEPLVYKGHQIMLNERPWWRKLFRLPYERNPKGVQNFRYIRKQFIEFKATAVRLNKPCSVDPEILEGMQSWIDFELELRGEPMGYR